MRKYSIKALGILIFLFIAMSGISAFGVSSSTSPSKADITITNNVGKADLINVVNLAVGDVVKVYNAATGGRMLGGASVPNYQSEVNINVTQLGSTAGSVFISVTSKGMLESNRTEGDFSAEPQSSALDPSNLEITNNVKKADTLYFTNLSDGDVVKAYSALSGGRLLGTAKVPLYEGEATINITQLGSGAGKIYVTITNTGKLESDRTEVDYSAEPISAVPDTNNVVITNNAGKPDTVYMTGLLSGDIVKLYSAATGGRLLASSTVPSDASEITLKVTQLGGTAGSVYITITSVGMLECGRTKVDYLAEATTDALDPNNITITNNNGKVDTVNVTGLQEGDMIKVYNAAAAGKLLATGVVASDATEVNINIAQLGIASGSVYLTNTNSGKLQSDRVQANYLAEPKTDEMSPSDVIVSNNVGTADTIDIRNLDSGDIVKVYNAAVGGTILGTVTVPSDITEETFSLRPLLTTSSSIYITNKSLYKLESDRVKVDYSAKPKTKVQDIDDIAIENYSGASDTISVNNVFSDQIVKVYDSAIGGKLLASGTVTAANTEITLLIKQLGTGSGSVYISVTTKGMLESDREKVDYSPEVKTDAPDIDNITVTNNALKPGTVKVTDLLEGDIVKVYGSAKGGVVLSTGTVPTSNNEITINTKLQGLTSGNIYISVTTKGEQESDKTEVTYGAVAKSVAPSVNYTTVSNYSGQADTIYITGLMSGDIIKVYNAIKAGSVIATGTVPVNGNSVTITIPQLGSLAGSVYLTATSINEMESDRTEIDYGAEQSSTPPDANNIMITNNAIIADTINVTGLSVGDVVKVYNLGVAGSVIGTGTVPANSDQATITISQLSSGAGTVYLTTTSVGKLESQRTAASYASETKSSTLASSNVVVTNNYGSSDTVRVVNLLTGDVIKVYDSAVGGNLLGSATVASPNSSATASINQLGGVAGSVYVTVTSTSKTESDRTKVDYLAETSSTAPDPLNVTIVNNAGKAGTITVCNLVGNDVITVYDSGVGGNILGTATVGTYDTQGIVSVAQLGSSAGSVYISITSKGKMESNRTKADFTAKPLSDAPEAGNITIVNNAGIQDTITVNNLQAQDIVKVYDALTGGNLLGTGTVGANSTQVVVPITQLGINAGSAYVSVTNLGKVEGNRTKVDYLAEAQTDSPIAGNITIENNVGKADTVTVTGLVANDVINVYSGGTSGNLLGTATVISGSSEATVSIQQIGTAAGSLYISVKSLGKTESSRTKADFKAESIAPDPANISIVNNAVISDIVTVSGLGANDLIKVYDSLQNGNLLGYATVASDSTTATVTISQLTANAGSVYISTTSFGMSESNRTKVDYIAEQSSNPPFIGNISITNNKGSADTITVMGLLPDSVVNVYGSLSGDTILGSAMVPASGTEATVSIPQLGIDAGSVYITVDNLGKTESSRTKADFASETP